MCQCKKNVKDSKQFTILPDDFCPICSEKHFSTAMQAMRELGYEDVNRNFIVGELELARKHIYKNKYLADKIRDIRHTIQYRKESTIQLGEWDDICRQLNRVIEAQLSKKKEKNNKNKGKVYVLGNNVTSDSLILAPEDQIIFLGDKPAPSDYKNNIKIRYHLQEEMPIAGCVNYYLTGKLKNIFYPTDFLETLKKEYDWNYEATTKEMSLAYIVVKHLAKVYEPERIILVNILTVIPETAHMDFEKKYLLAYTQIGNTKTLP